MQRLVHIGLAVVALLLMGLAGSAQAQLYLPGMGPGSAGGYQLPVRSLRDMRFASVIRQERDFSCGSAALATLLHYHYGIAAGESDVFTGMWRDGDQDRIRRLGFSLLDMKRFLEARGLSADGFTVDLDRVEKAKLPGIALLNINGYKHFVVVKGVRTDRVLIGDPALGLRAMSRKRFTQSWNGVYFIVRPERHGAMPLFNASHHWNATPRWGSQAAEESGRINQLQPLRLLTPAAGEF